MYSLMSKRRNCDAERLGELLGDLGLADAGRAGEQERADRLLGGAEAGARELDRRHERARCARVLAEDRELQVALERRQAIALSDVDTLRGGICAIVATTVLDVLRRARVFFAPGRRAAAATIGAGLVDHVDRLVGQLAVVDVLGRRAWPRRAAPRRCT